MRKYLLLSFTFLLLNISFSYADTTLSLKYDRSHIKGLFNYSEAIFYEKVGLLSGETKEKKLNGKKYTMIYAMDVFDYESIFREKGNYIFGYSDPTDKPIIYLSLRVEGIYAKIPNEFHERTQSDFLIDEIRTWKKNNNFVKVNLPRNTTLNIYEKIENGYVERYCFFDSPEFEAITSSAKYPVEFDKMFKTKINKYHEKVVEIYKKNHTKLFTNQVIEPEPEDNDGCRDHDDDDDSHHHEHNKHH